MSFEIKENRGIFEICGKLTAQDTGVLKSYFDHILEKYENLVVSLESVTEMDSSVAHFFEELYQKAVRRNKVIAIMGRQNTDISEIVSITRTAYIFSADRI